MHTEVVALDLCVVLCCVVLCDTAGTAIALMAFARHKGVNLSVLGIGVDFLQVRALSF